MKKITALEAQQRPGLTRSIVEKFIRNNKHLCEKRQDGRHWIWYVDARAIDKLQELYAIPDGFIDTKEAAALAAVNANTINQWCMNGYVTARKLPSRVWLVDLKSLEKFLEIRAEASRDAASWATAGGNLGLHMKEPAPLTPAPQGDSICPAFSRNLATARMIVERCHEIEKERYG